MQQNLVAGPAGTPPINTAPLVDAGADRILTLPNSIALQGSFSDDGLPNPPGAVTVSWSQFSGPGTASFGDTTSPTSTVSFDVAGEYVLRLTVSDGEFSTSDDVTVTVNEPAPNTAPVLQAIGNQVLDEGDSLTLPLTATDSDGNTLSFGHDGLPAFAALTDNGNGTATLSLAPGFNDNGLYPITIRVTDNGIPALFDEETFNVTVNDVNQAPQIAPIANITIVEGGMLTVALSASDADGDGVDFSSPDLPGFAVLNNLAGNTAEIVFTPGSADVGGPLTVTVEATDDASLPLTGTTSFTVTVLAFEPRVTAGLLAYYPLTEGSGTLVGDQSGNGTPLNLSVSGNVSWLGSGNGVSFNGGRIGSSAPAAKIINALIASGASSFEVWAMPANTTQDGPARLVSVGGDVDNQNYVLGQDGADYQVRLLHTGKDSKARPRLQTSGGVAVAQQHIVHTFNGSVETLYINGVAQPDQVIDSGNYSNWDATDLFNIGNESSNNRPFAGEIYLVAVYDRALSAAEVQQNFVAGADASGGGPMPNLSFTDITSAAGVSGPPEFGGHGIQFADVNGNGLPDFYVTRNFVPTDMAEELYLNQGDGTFLEEAAIRGIDNFDSGSHGGVWADLDNDGDYDLFNGSFDQNRLYRNDGSGFFTDVTVLAGLPVQSLPTRSVIAFDMDGDGDLDIFAVTNFEGSNDPAGELNEVYRNDGGFTFTSVSGGDLAAAPVGQGAIAVDYDNDGDIDIIAGNRTGPLNVLQNDGSGVFTLIDPLSIGITLSAGNGITAADVNNDGLLDLLLDQHLFLGTGAGQFSFERSFETGTIHYMGGFADLDNDGDFDLVFPGRNYVYLNDGSGVFTQSTTFPLGTVNDPRSVAFADIDNDGDLDFAYAQKRHFNLLVRNNLTSTNSWLKIALLRASGQAGAFGARVFVFEPGGMNDPAQRITWSEATGATGYLAQDNPELHFGVGERTTVDVRVDFHNGPSVELAGLPTNGLHLIEEPVTP